MTPRGLGAGLPACTACRALRAVCNLARPYVRACAVTWNKQGGRRGSLAYSDKTIPTALSNCQWLDRGHGVIDHKHALALGAVKESAVTGCSVRAATASLSQAGSERSLQLLRVKVTPFHGHLTVTEEGLLGHPEVTDVACSALTLLGAYGGEVREDHRQFPSSMRARSRRATHSSAAS